MRVCWVESNIRHYGFRLSKSNINVFYHFLYDYENSLLYSYFKNLFLQVGMSIDPKLLLSNFPAISVILGLLIIGKTLLVTFVGRLFGVSTIAAIRAGLMLAPGGEFAFVAFGDAVNQVRCDFFFNRTSVLCLSFVSLPMLLVL